MCSENGKLVFIIILNWNGWEDTIECIESCQKMTYLNYKILIIDNASTDRSEIILRKKLPRIDIIQAGTNLGFAGGVNVGIKYALKNCAHYVWLLNNDTKVDERALEELVKVAESDSEIGMVGSKILLYSDPDILNSVGSEISLKTGFSRHVGAGEKDDGQYDFIREVEFLTGCSILVKKEMIEKIGLMKEEYFVYFEESEWCIQARENGFKLIFCPFSKVFHKISCSVKKISEVGTYYFYRNRLFFLQRNGLSVKWSHRVIVDLKKWVALMLKFDFKNSYMILLAYFHWINNLSGPIFDLKKVDYFKKNKSCRSYFFL